MDYLQYAKELERIIKNKFNVLNLIINGLPSIQTYNLQFQYIMLSFKPYYKWITFNTKASFSIYL